MKWRRYQRISGLYRSKRLCNKWTKTRRMRCSRKPKQPASKSSWSGRYTHNYSSKLKRERNLPWTTPSSCQYHAKDGIRSTSAIRSDISWFIYLAMLKRQLTVQCAISHLWTHMKMGSTNVLIKIVIQKKLMKDAQASHLVSTWTVMPLKAISSADRVLYMKLVYFKERSLLGFTSTRWEGIQLHIQISGLVIVSQKRYRKQSGQGRTKTQELSHSHKKLLTRTQMNSQFNASLI